MDTTTQEASPVLTTGALRTRYDAIIDEGAISRTRPEEVVTQRSKGHELITRIEMEGVEVTGIDVDSDCIQFQMAHGFIRQRPGLGGFETLYRTGRKLIYRFGDTLTTDPVTILRTYVDVMVPAAIAANGKEEREDREEQERIDAAIAKDAAIVAAYQELPAEMRDGFKVMLTYLALAERRDSSGFHRQPPMANMLLRTLKQTEERGIPAADARTAGDSFMFRH